MKQIFRLLLLATVLMSFSAVAGAEQDTTIPALVQFRLVIDEPEWPLLSVIDPLGETLYLDKKVIIDNDKITKAKAKEDIIPSEYGVEIILNEISRQEFKKFTRVNIGRRVVILIDSKLADVVTIREPIDSGTCFVRNKLIKPFTKAEAELFAREITAVPDLENPEEVARAYIIAKKQKGWPLALAQFAHTEELTKFRELLLPQFEKEAVAGRQDALKGLFGKNATMKDVRALSPREFLGGIMETASKAPMAMSIWGLEKLEILGTTHEGKVVHVRARLQIREDGKTVTKEDVVSLKQDGPWWRPLLKLEELARGYAKMIAKRAAE